MTIEWRCKCGLKLKAKDEVAGKKTKCPKCSTVMVIPAPAQGSAAEEDVLSGLAGGEVVSGGTCPYCGGTEVSPETQVCRKCGRHIHTGVQAVAGARRLDRTGETSRGDAIWGEIKIRAKQYRILLIIGALMAGWCGFWVIVPSANRAAMEEIQSELQGQFGNEKLSKLEIDIPYAPMSVPEELDVIGMYQITHRSAGGVKHYTKYEMRGRYVRGDTELLLRSKDKKLTIWGRDWTPTDGRGPR